MSNEQIISEFLRTAYSDEKLAALLAHAEDGKLAFMSCCCFIGVATADHALRSAGQMYDGGSGHYARAGRLLNAGVAENAYRLLAGDEIENPDKVRREKLIPLIHAEIARREAERNSESQAELVHTV